MFLSRKMYPDRVLAPIYPQDVFFTLMRKILLLLLFILSVLTLVSCGPRDQATYNGNLYYAQSNYLMRYGLEDGSLSVVTNLGDKTIRDVSGFLENRLLIAESISINRMNVRRISWVDVNTGQTFALYAGVLARYLEGSGIVVYDDGDRLLSVALSGESDREIIFNHKSHQVSSMMVVSENIVLFETSESGDRRIRSYDTTTGKLETLDRLSGVCRLDQAVWIHDLKQMACKDRSSQTKITRHILTNLDGDVTRTLALPEGKSFDLLTYIRGQDALILKERWNNLIDGQERSAIWVYNLLSEESHRLEIKRGLGSSVVYSRY